jgi:hypothetical protein
MTTLNPDVQEDSSRRPVDPSSLIWTLDELRSNLYIYRLIDACWFEGLLPTNANQSFLFDINPLWPDGYELPTSIRGITNLSESERQYIARRLKKPEWVTAPEQVTLVHILGVMLKRRAGNKG